MKERIAGVIRNRGKLFLVALCVSAGLGAVAVQALGSFGKPRGFAVGKYPDSIAIGRLNGDAKRDIAVAGGAGVSVLLGRGDGSFGPARSYLAGSDPRSIVAGKFNGDADLDLAVVNVGPIDCEGRPGGAQASSCVGGFGSVSVLLGRGDGTFGAPTAFPVGDASRWGWSSATSTPTPGRTSPWSITSSTRTASRSF